MTKPFHLITLGGYLVLALMGCKNDSKQEPLPSSPKEVVRYWQNCIDINDFDNAKRLSTPNTIEWIEWISTLVDTDENVEEIVPEFQTIKCEGDSMNLTCVAIMKEMGETYLDTFLLVKKQQQWLIDIPSEELEPSSTLDSLFQHLETTK